MELAAGWRPLAIGSLLACPEKTEDTAAADLSHMLPAHVPISWPVVELNKLPVYLS